MTDTMITLTPYQIATREHVAADMLMARTYGEQTPDGLRGCSIGCLAHTMLGRDTGEGSHRDLVSVLGVPEWFLHLQDQVFEGLPDMSARQRWHRAMADVRAALPDDYDWSLALHRVRSALMDEALTHAGNTAEVVRWVRLLHERAAAGDLPTDAEWNAAWSAAEGAAEGAAKSAAESAAWSVARYATKNAAWNAAKSAAESATAIAAIAAGYAADSAAIAAGYAAESAARSAAANAAESAESAAESAESAAYQSIADSIVLALLDGRPLPDTAAIDAAYERIAA